MDKLTEWRFDRIRTRKVNIGSREALSKLSTADPASDPRSRSIFVADRLAITVAAILLFAAAISWVASYYLMPLMGASADMMGMGVAAIVSSLSISSVGVFEFIWVVGMAAMMFPAMLPMVLFYNRIVTRAESNQRTVHVAGTSLFLMGYLATYALLGFAAYVAVFISIGLASSAPALSTLAFVGPGLVLIIAGLYQLTPMKVRCLSQCVSPIGFFAIHSRNGLSGAIRMGLSHGIYCVGCCWAYMLVMLAVAAMSIPFMAVLAGVIALEKVLVRGATWFTRAVAGGFLILGVAVLLFPGILGYLSLGI
jgi:predicted metal-binding membrane protein